MHGSRLNSTMRKETGILVQKLETKLAEQEKIDEKNEEINLLKLKIERKKKKIELMKKQMEDEKISLEKQKKEYSAKFRDIRSAKSAINNWREGSWEHTAFGDLQ
jgi:hypothetical protein